MGEDWKEARQSESVRVQVHIVQDIDYWCAKFGCSEANLRSAVSHAGTVAEDVRQYLMTAAGDPERNY